MSFSYSSKFFQRKFINIRYFSIKTPVGGIISSGFTLVTVSNDDLSACIMPSGKGVLFLAVNAEIRKKIQKQAGDYVHIVLYPDNEPIEIPKEFLLCLQDDIVALQFFNSLIESEQYKYIRWIYSAKGEQTRVDRIAKTVTQLANRKKFADKE